MKEIKRDRYLVLGVLILLIVGIVYAWSVLSVPIAAEFSGWTKAQLSLTFTLTMTGFCIGSVLSGVLSKKITPRMFIILAAIMIALGFLLTSRTQSLGQLYIGFGILCGVGGGFAYNMVLSTVAAWFPDKQGMVSGVLLMGFGLSSFIIGKIFTALTPDETGAWRHSFIVLAVIALVVVAVCGTMMKRPDRDLSSLATAQSKKKVREPAMEATAGQMLKKPPFWFYYIYSVMVSVAGLALLSQGSGIVWQVGPAISAGTVATLVGLISVFNGLSRIFFGSFFDKAGFRKTISLDLVLFFVACFLLLGALRSGSMAMLTAGFVMGGLAYGGVTPTNAALTSDFFGRENYPMNLPITNTNLMVASFGSAIAGRLYDASGSYMSTIIMMTGVTVVATISSICLRRPGLSGSTKKTETDEVSCAVEQG